MTGLKLVQPWFIVGCTWVCGIGCPSHDAPATFSAESGVTCAVLGVRFGCGHGNKVGAAGWHAADLHPTLGTGFWGLIVIGAFSDQPQSCAATVQVVSPFPFWDLSLPFY